MPKSKRSKVVSLTKTEKKGRANKEALVQEIQENVDEWKYLWLFHVGEMRNTHLKDIRADWKGTGRLFFGRVSVMAIALGKTEETEYKPGLHEIASKLRGQVGLFFTSWDPKETLDYFESVKRPDFARAGSEATQEITVPAGPLTPIASAEDIAEGIKPTSFPSSMEPHLRKLGLSTRLEKGVITMAGPQTVCRKGDKLTAEQAQILKLLGVKMSMFRVTLVCMWEKDTGKVSVQDTPLEDGEYGDGSDADDDEEMDE